MVNIPELKAKYGRIFKATSISTKVDIYFRLLTKLEYDTYIMMAVDNTTINLEAEEYIFNCAIVYPSLADIQAKLLFGEYHAIAEAVSSTSGFHEMGQFAAELKQRRIGAQTLIDQMLIAISKAFPTYKISDLDAMNYQQLARLLALAETMLETYLQIPGAEVPGLTAEPERELASKPIIEQRQDFVDHEQIERQRLQALEALKASRNKQTLF